MLINNIRKSPTCPIRNTIHAPTRGATASCIIWSTCFPISIHAPTRGATIWNFRCNRREYYFNPRSYKRSDMTSDKFVSSKALISIHAPTRGATQPSQSPSQSAFISIHAPTRGATHKPFRKCYTLPYFNPRSYKRSDELEGDVTEERLSISIHAPTRGATARR